MTDAEIVLSDGKYRVVTAVTDENPYIWHGQPCLSLDEPLDFLGPETDASPRKSYLFQFSTPSRRVYGLHLQTHHVGNLFRR